MEFASRDQAQHAVSTLSNQDLMGRLVYVREVSWWRDLGDGRGIGSGQEKVVVMFAASFIALSDPEETKTPR